jgi:hypothetical protein
MRFAHDPGYVAKLGAALYAFQSVEWVMIEILGKLRTDRGARWSAGRTSGQIARALRDALLMARDPQSLGEKWIQLTETRDDIVHARPATDPDGRQRLFRWAPTRQAVARFITDDDLDGFIQKLESMSGLAETYRRGNRGHTPS